MARNAAENAAGEEKPCCQAICLTDTFSERRSRDAYILARYFHLRKLNPVSRKNRREKDLSDMFAMSAISDNVVSQRNRIDHIYPIILCEMSALRNEAAAEVNRAQLRMRQKSGRVFHQRRDPERPLGENTPSPACGLNQQNATAGV